MGSTANEMQAMEFSMKHPVGAPLLLALLLCLCGGARAADVKSTVELFKNAGASASFFSRSYGYAVFPTVGSGALGVGGAFGKGRVYLHGHYVGNANMGQVSVGFQAGGKAYSEIIFFEDKRALDEFESGSFEFGADASVVAITAGANASAATNGASAGASGTEDNAITRGVFHKGMAVFTVAKGGLMYSAAVAGQKFSFTPVQAGH
jgi:lipid-binding SYLF domain-containing protein